MRMQLSHNQVCFIVHTFAGTDIVENYYTIIDLFHIY